MAITPLELRNRARERISSRSNANYSEYYKKQVEQQVLKDEQSNSNKNGFIRTMATAGDVLGNVFLGLAKGTEGLFDFTIGSIATPIGLFNSNFAEGVKSVIKYNAVDDLVGNRMQDALKDSYLKESGIMEGVSQGIGQMLPAVALSFIPYVGPGVALAYTASSAAGNASEQAYQEGAGLIQGQVYGAAVGGVEAATEKIFGGATSKVFGAGKLDNIFGKVAKTGVARVVKNAAEEGFEEVVAEVANPALKSIYKGKDAFKEYGDAEYWKDVAKAGVIGAGTSVAYGGTVGKITRTSGIDADISDSLQEINTLDNKRRNLYADGNLTAERKKYYYETKLANLENIEKGLKKSTVKERARRIEKNGLEKYFEQNGSLKASVRANLEKGMQSTAESDSRYISPDLEDNIEKVNSDIESISQTLKTKYGAEAEDIKVYDKELTQKGEGEYKKLKTVQKAFNKKSGVNVGLVVLDENSNFDGTLVDDTIYITKDKLENGDWSKVIVHENFHFAKGTKEYRTLFDYLTSLDVEVVDASGKSKRVSLDKLATDKVLRKGYLTAEQLENIKNKTKNNQKLTEQERAIAEEYTDELGAHMSEEVLGNEEFINKIISDSKNKNLIEKIINKIVDLKNAFQRAKMSKADESLKTLETAEKLYLDAIEKAGYAYIGRKLVVVKKDDEDLTDVRYSYIGRKAKSVDLTTLDKAMQRIDSGEDAETVRKETGWFKGYDGEWRYEISDKNALLLDNDKFETHFTDDGSYYTAKLSDVLDHKQLFEAYPQLKDLTLIIQETEFGTDGISFANDNQIVINKGLFQRNTKEYNDVLSEKQKRIKEIEKTPEYKEYSMFFESDYDEIGITPEQWLEREEAAEKKFFDSELGKEYYKLVWGKTSDDIVKKELGWSDMAISVLLHELQHHIQFIEGFAAGSSDTFWYKKMLNRYKSEYESSRTEFLKLLQRAKGDFREALYLLETAVDRFDLSETMIARACDNASKFTEDENELQILWNFTEAGKTLNMFYKKGDLLASHMYEKTAGEIEARDVARRREMSDQERKDIRPNINERGVVFVEDVDKSIALSYNKKEKYAKRDFNSVTEEEFKHHYWAVANNLLSKEELGVLNSAIGNISRGEIYEKNADGLYMIPVGKNQVYNKVVFTNGKQSSYTVDYIVEIQCEKESNLDNALGLLYEQEKNGIPTKTTNLFKIYYSKDFRYSDFRASLGKSSENSGRKQDGTRSDREVKFSLKDSDGNALSPEQQEFFKDSKVLDENGNLLVVYHGSSNKFTEFDYNKTRRGKMGYGFYFTHNVNLAKQYSIDDNIVTAYLNIENPLVIEKTQLTNNHIEKMLERLSDFELKKSGVSIDSLRQEIINQSSIISKNFKFIEIAAKYQDILENMGDVIGFDGIINANWDEYVAFKPNQIKLTTNKNPTENNDIRFSLKEKITINMTDSERYEILKDKVIESVPVAKELTQEQLKNIEEISSFEDLNKYFGSEKKKIIKKIASEFGVFKEYYNDDIQLQFEFSKGNYNESYGKQKHNFISYAKMFTAFDKVVENAVGIEVHNRNIENYKKDRTLKRVYVLASAFIDGKNIVPVKLEVKEFSDKKNTLYVAIALESIKKDEFSRQEVANGVAQQYRPSSTISIRDLLKNVNPNDKDFYKYIPKQFFEDIRFSRKEKVESRNLTQGEMRKMLANYTKKKVYSKAESEIVANEIIDKILVFDDKYGSIKGKTKAEAISMLWNALNTKDAGHRMGPALDIADYFIEHAIVTDMFEEAEYDESLTFISVAKEFLHKLDLKGIREEIKHKFENNSVYLMWSGGTIGPDELPGLLAERGIVLSSELGSEAFFELHERYLKARDTINNKAKKALQHVLSTEEIKELRQKIAREILLAYNEKGAESKLSKILNEHNKELKSLREKARENRRYSNQVGRVMFQVDKMKKIKNGTFLNATTYKQDVLKKSVEELAKVTNRGVISSKTRDIISRLKSWYTKENPMLGYYSDTEPGSYDFNIAESLEYIASGTQRELTYKELLALEDVVAYFNNFAEKFNNIWRNGKYVEAKTIAEDYVSIQQENEKYKSFIFNTKLPLVTKWYSAYADPMSIARKLDRYNPNGFFTEMMENLRYGAIDSANIEYKLRSTVEEFYSKNKKYLKTLKTEKCVKYEGYLLTKAQAISLYMTLSRQQAILGLAASGFAYIDVETKKPVRIKGFAEDAVLDNLPQLETLARAAKADLLRQFNSTDAEYIQILEKVFNEDCKNYKSETDKKRNGYTNVSDGYYFPVRRNALAKNIETISLFEEINSVSNASFNKDTVKGAKTELYIEDVDVVFDRHVKGIAQYAGLATVIDEFNILLNANVGDNVNKPITVATESAQLWGGAINYFRDMLKDIQGIGAKNSGVVNWLRGNYAKAVLGANPKVLFTQLSSVFASLNILSVENLVKGVNISAKFADGLDEYSVVAKVRNSDNTVVKAQGVIDEIGAVGNALTKPIAMVDRGVVKLLWGPCQLQVQKEQGLALGTKENKIEAGKLLDKVILETQQNSLASEKTAAARSNSEFLRASVMFRADIIKLTGRFFDAIGENLVLSKKLKLATSLSEQVEIKKQLNKAKKKLVSSICSLSLSSLYIALIAKAFRWLYNKDEDENVWKNIVVDFFGNILGGFPIISDVYSKIFEGYDVDSFEYSTINNVISSFENLAKTDWTDSNSITSSFKKAMDSMAQFLGLPSKNIYKNIYGILDKFNPEAAYKLDNLFYNKNYSSDLKKAIENEDMDMIATITGIMLNENIGDVGSESVRSEMNKLIADGQSVLPRSVGDSITYDGEVLQLTARQKARFKTIYSKANNEIADLIRTKHYINASNEIKAKAIKFIYDMYYNLALEDLLGEELVTKNLLFSKAIDIDKLAIIVTSSRNLKADTDSKGNAISGSKKSKVYAYVQSLKMTAAEKYMIMGYLGYTNTKGDKQVKSYIQSLKMTKKQKELLYEYSGYAI